MIDAIGFWIAKSIAEFAVFMLVILAIILYAIIAVAWGEFRDWRKRRRGEHTYGESNGVQRWAEMRCRWCNMPRNYEFRFPTCIDYRRSGNP